MDNRSILAIVMCVLFYLGYTHYLSTKYPKPEAQQTGAVNPQEAGANPAASPAAATSAVASPATPLAGGTAAATPTAQHLSPEDLHLSTDLVDYRFSQETGGIASVHLNNYKVDIGQGSLPIDLLDSALALQGTTDIRGATPYVGLYHAERNGRTLKFWREVGDFRIAQEFRIPDVGYGGELKISFTNISTKAVELTGGLIASESILPKKNPNVLGIIPGTVRQRDQIIYDADNSTDWIDVEKFCKDDKDPPKIADVPIKFFGVDRHYFLGILEPKAKTGSLRLDHGKQAEAGCPLNFVNYDRQGLVQPGETVAMEFNTFFGPKDLTTMKEHSAELEGAMHLGTFAFIGRPLLSVIQGFFKVTKNYGIAIILLTICLKLLFYPLMRASSISMYKMKKLNPQMQEIRDRLKDDKQRQQQELMKFMVANKINPMKGCLPMLPSIPVFFAFYQVLQTSIALRHAPFMGWIQDLSAMDPYFVTPLLMGGAMFLQQKLTPTTGMDKTQEKILMFMPIMFTVMMLSLPAGLTLYMLTNTVVGISQQRWLNYRMGLKDKAVPA